MKCTPKRMNRIADAAFIVCFLSAAVLYIASGNVDSYRSVIQLAAIILFTAGLYILIRYKLMNYNYIIRTRNIDDSGYTGAGDLDFVAEKVQGNRMNAECRLSFDDLAEFKKLPQKGGRKREDIRKYGNHIKLYHYTVTMYPPEPYLMVFYDHTSTSEEARIGIVFEPDKKMADYITNLYNKLQLQRNMGGHENL